MERREAERFAVKLDEAIVEFIRHGAKYARRERGPSRSQFFMMRVLESDGPLRTADLAAALDISSPAVTGAVNALIKMDCVYRQEDPGDRRATLIDLTPHGRRMIARVQRERRERAVGLLQQFEADEIDAFLRTLKKMAQYIK